MSLFAETGNEISFDIKFSNENTMATAANQTQYIVICGQCGAVEKHIGPHKTECPNCDDYIY